MTRVTLFAVLTCGASLGGSPVTGAVITIRLDNNNFVADPLSAVNISAGGLFAVIQEEHSISPVFLSNDPGLGDPIVLFASSGVTLSFDFQFLVGTTQFENDEFGAFVLNSTGIQAGLAFEFFTSANSSGTVTFDLSTLTSEAFLGLQFQLSSLPGDIGLDTIVTIANVQLNVPTSAAVPEPSTMTLFAGFAALAGISNCFRWRRRCQLRGSPA